VAPEPLTQPPGDEPDVHPFPAGKLAPLLRAMADPGATGALSDAEHRAIACVENNARPGTD
jgi:hypothetical protein